VSATNAIGESANSSQASATPQISTPVVACTNVFIDTFSSSTLNPTATSPGTLNSSTTAYEIASTKNATTTSIAANTLTLATSATTSGYTEAQALFTTTPITLNSAGQYIELYCTFTGTNNVFNGAAGNNTQITLGLFNSGGGNAPTNGTALWNGGLVTSATTATNGACKDWLGYNGMFPYSASSAYNSYIESRPAQTQANNSCQALGDSAGSGYDSGATVASMTGVVGQPQLTNGDQYTMDIRITYVNSTTLAVTNTLYNGAGNGGTVFSAGGWTGQYGAQAASPLTMTYDSLVVGYRPGTSPSVTTTLQINRIAVISTGAIIPAIPPKITSFSLVGGNVVINGTNGINGGTYYLLGSTNVGLPLNQWTALATNVVGASGGNGNFNFTGTNAVISNHPQQFYILSSTNE
jgi:hypothetical protein